MKWTDYTVFFGGVAVGALLFAGCGHGNDRPAEDGSTQVNPSDNLPSGIDGTPPVSKPPDTPAQPLEGNPGKAQEDNPEKTPAPAGSTPATGGP